MPDSASSDEENEDGDFTVYECPGLAPVRRLRGGCRGDGCRGGRVPVLITGVKPSPNPEAAEPLCLPAVPSAPTAAALCPEMRPSMGPGRGRGASVSSRPIPSRWPRARSVAAPRLPGPEGPLLALQLEGTPGQGSS